MKRAIGLWVGLLVVCTTASTFADDLGKNFEASMVVTGTITVNPDGSVNGYTLDQQDKLPPAVMKVAAATLPNWKFQPVLDDGKPVSAKSLMSLRIVAHPIDEQHATVRITGASFGLDVAQASQLPECTNGACLISKRRSTPSYPIDNIRAGVSGTVYLVQKIDRAGNVEQQAVKQVNLRQIGDATEIRRWAKAFAEASLAVGQSWSYQVPTSGDEAKHDHWIVSVPVNFTLGNYDYAYGQWEPYIPGLVQEIPWAEDDARVASNGSSDAMPDSGIAFVADSRFVLLTPVGDGAAPGAP